MNKPELVAACKMYRKLESQVSKTFVDRTLTPDNVLFKDVDTSSTRDVGQILRDLHATY